MLSDFSPLFVTWKKAINGAEPRLRGCIGTLEARDLINGFRDYALTSGYGISSTYGQATISSSLSDILLFFEVQVHANLPGVLQKLFALRDRRFSPIQAKELPFLECTVSVLTNYESALHYLDWEVGKHGLIIEFTDPDNNIRRSGTYLPEVAAHEETSILSKHRLDKDRNYRFIDEESGIQWAHHRGTPQEA
ncbi:uncharacterized protein A4U43_C07F12980 [Asparagus officinalis]|uniref:AMMECR1 domain-containing protein n=1 Tax=Asparagus officinalis TaxID=4686 RepID=A0A5P1EBJ6_ASPOF|nr:uncharacterized protein A4U43_C07F12980 [Asparagus officinalis]